MEISKQISHTKHVFLRCLHRDRVRAV